MDPRPMNPPYRPAHYPDLAPEPEPRWVQLLKIVSRLLNTLVEVGLVVFMLIAVFKGHWSEATLYGVILLLLNDA